MGFGSASNSIEYPDLTCKATPFPEWQQFKFMLDKGMDKWSANNALRNVRHAHLESLLAVATNTLEQVYHYQEECGMDRLCVTLLGIAAGEAGGSLLGVTTIHSPLLTLFLDI